MPHRSARVAALTCALALWAAAPSAWSAAPSAPAPAPGAPAPAARARTADEAIAKAIAYLRSQQDSATGGWSVPTGEAGKGRPHLPAIASLALQGMLMQPGLDAADPAIAKGLAYVLSHRQPDGGIYDAILPSYNTAISLSMLARAATPEANAAIGPAQEFLKRSQWGAASPAGGREAPKPVDPAHPFYGGLGYGNRGRPDISNTQFALEAFRDTRLPEDDEAWSRAVLFLQRMQMLDSVNDQPYADGSRQGGFIYATGENDATAGKGQSFAGTFEETLSDGAKASRLRAYGSVTYAGFKSYLYAGLKPSDPRVLAAMGWMQSNFTLRENPGIGADGYYYYLLAMSRALQASGLDRLDVRRPAPLVATLRLSALPPGATEDAIAAALAPFGKVGAVGLEGSSAWALMGDEADARKALAAGRIALGPATVEIAPAAAEVAAPAQVDWRQALVDRLIDLQNPDGSFRSVDDRWMEDNPVLITAYALLALQTATR